MPHRPAVKSTFSPMPEWERRWICEGVGIRIPSGYEYVPIQHGTLRDELIEVGNIGGTYEPPPPPDVSFPETATYEPSWRVEPLVTVQIILGALILVRLAWMAVVWLAS